MRQGKAFIFSAPSGSGKTTIVKHLLRSLPELSFSISATNRSARSNEEEGKDYYFLSHDSFLELTQKDGFLEYEEVYSGRYYGTLRKEVQRIWADGKHVVFDVDVVGGVNLKKQLGENALAIFVRVPSLEVLQKRLTDRGSESEEDLKNRIAKAKAELEYEVSFDVSLINDKLEDTLKEAEHLVNDFLKK